MGTKRKKLENYSSSHDPISGTEELNISVGRGKGSYGS